MIRLRDGETNMLAGLIRDEERRVLDGIPGLSDMPVVGRLFAHNRTEINQTDIILTLTPHIIRVLDVSEDDLRAFRVGRDSRVAARRRFAAGARHSGAGTGDPASLRRAAARRSKTGPAPVIPGRSPGTRPGDSPSVRPARRRPQSVTGPADSRTLRVRSLYASFDTLAPSPCSRSTSCA